MRVALLSLISALFAACIAPVFGQNTATITNDIATLNYALALENLEAVYYSCYLYPLNTTNSDCNGRGYNGFSQAQFASEGFNSSVWQAVNAIAAQELSHQALLTATIAGATGQTGISPVPRCSYNLGALASVTNVASFMALASSLEQVGVSAYAGAVNTISDPILLQVAVTIADVEARHSAWLYQLLGNQPFATSGYENYLTPAAVAATVLPVLNNNASCAIGVNQSLPTTRPYGVAGIANSQSTNYTGRLSQAAGVSYSATQRANDLNVLQYALLLESLEASFYNAAFAFLSAANFTNAGYPTSAYTYANIVGLNENTHVAALRAAIVNYGGTPIGNCTYNFTGALSSFQNFLNTAQSLANLGTSAYTGAANMITDTNLLTIAATIDMVEARHAAFYNVLNTNPRNNTNAFPAAYDTALTPAAVQAAVIASGLATNCPAITLPSTLPQNAGIPSSTGLVNPIVSSSGRNGASSTSSLSLMMIVVAIIASLALLL